MVKLSIECLWANKYIVASRNKGVLMRTVEVRKAKMSQLLIESEKSHEPIHIIGEKSTGVLISLDDWQAIQETLYLLSIPKMRESIVRGLKTPVEKCSSELAW